MRHRFATLIPALLNLLMPWAAGVHYGFVFALRFVMGFFGVSHCDHSMSLLITHIFRLIITILLDF